jgi:FAD synthase
MKHCEFSVAVEAPLRGWIDCFGRTARQPRSGGQAARPPCVVAIGKFDGIHRGHRILLEEVVAQARRRGLSAGVVSFDAHPRQVLFGEQHGALATLDDRRKLLRDTGVDFHLLLHACPELFALEAEAFAQRLVEAINCQVVVIGPDFRFGRKARGDRGTLMRVRLEVAAIDLLAKLGRKVSSTRVREVLRAGDVEQAKQLLGRSHRVYGALTGNRTRQWSMEPVGGLLIPAVGSYRGQVVFEGTNDALPALLQVFRRDHATKIVAIPLDPFATAGRPQRSFGWVLFERQEDEAFGEIGETDAHEEFTI